MPNILARQPAWLDRNTPAFDFFQSNKSRQEEDEQGRDAPVRKIAHRGTEIFAVVGDELRWSDLAMLRNASSSSSSSGTAKQPAYKVWQDNVVEVENGVKKMLSCDIRSSRRPRTRRFSNSPYHHRETSWQS